MARPSVLTESVEEQDDSSLRPDRFAEMTPLPRRQNLFEGKPAHGSRPWPAKVKSQTPKPCPSRLCPLTWFPETKHPILLLCSAGARTICVNLPLDPGSRTTLPEQARNQNVDEDDAAGQQQLIPKKPALPGVPLLDHRVYDRVGLVAAFGSDTKLGPT